jgi:uncharacterized protein YggE
VNNPLVNSLKVPFLTILFIFILLYGFSALFGPLPISVRSTVSTQSDLFTAEGTGEVMASPNNATFTVGVTQNATTSEQATNLMNETTNEIIAQLRSTGIKNEDIKTTGYNVYPNQDFTNGRNNITGYTASQNLEIKADSVELANKALAAATASGANTVSGVNFTVDDQEMKKLQQEALKKAVADAKENASDIANAAGIKLGRIVSIRQNQGVGSPVPMYKAEMANDARGGSTSPELQPGQNAVTVTVTLSYETL